MLCRKKEKPLFTFSSSQVVATQASYCIQPGQVWRDAIKMWPCASKLTLYVAKNCVLHINILHAVIAENISHCTSTFCSRRPPIRKYLKRFVPKLANKGTFNTVDLSLSAVHLCIRSAIFTTTVPFMGVAGINWPSTFCTYCDIIQKNIYSHL